MQHVEGNILAIGYKDPTPTCIILISYSVTSLIYLFYLCSPITANMFSSNFYQL